MDNKLNNNKTTIMSRSKKFYVTNKLVILLLALSSILFSTKTFGKSGEELFKSKCAACHTTTERQTVGPGLAGISEKRDAEWLIKWIKNSANLISSGDKDAVAVFEKFNKIAMPSFEQFSDEEIASMLNYIKKKNEASSAKAANPDQGDTNDLASANNGKFYSQWSGWIIGLLIFSIVMLFFVIAYTLRVLKQVDAMQAPHSIKKFPVIFLLFVLIALFAIFGISHALTNDMGRIKEFFFSTFPYVTLAIFFIGSVYRYTQKGFKVSSLSTQFLEGKKLFWGSQPFHWGLMVLFFGHLIAFLFPNTLLAWNGAPYRLLILEISSFAFALLALLGLILLIRRRLTSKSIMTVTNKMDMVVYITLLTQIISGLTVAFFVRWGSSWFASVLTPYLKSIFTLSPDIAAISAAPIYVQIHIISAFLIIAVIPFSRFMHFLVVPLDYTWRRYQQVVWNWDRETIRSSTKWFFGKKPKNH